MKNSFTFCLCIGGVDKTQDWIKSEEKKSERYVLSRWRAPCFADWLNHQAMYLMLILVVFSSVISADENRNDDRYYFDLIVDVLSRYPLLKQTLIRLCARQIDKCKNPSFCRLAISLVDDDQDLQELFQVLINCFLPSTPCRLFEKKSMANLCAKKNCSIGRNESREFVRPDSTDFGFTLLSREDLSNWSLSFRSSRHSFSRSSKRICLDRKLFQWTIETVVLDGFPSDFLRVSRSAFVHLLLFLRARFQNSRMDLSIFISI